jgi:hypothetical protein
MSAAAFRATYSDWRLIKGRKVVQIVFELPLELSGSAYDALGGMPNTAAEVWCGIARLDVSKIGGNEVANGEALSLSNPGLASPSIHEGEAAGPSTLAVTLSATTASASRRGEPSPDKPLKERKPTKPEDRLKLKAALLCSAPMFWTYFGERLGQTINNAETAATFLRGLCGVTSRREIISNTPAGDKFEQLYSDFTIWRDHPELVTS